MMRSRQAGLLLNFKEAVMDYVTWQEFLAFCLRIVTAIESTMRTKKQPPGATGNRLPCMLYDFRRYRNAILSVEQAL